jgi:DNA-binding NarL/FixJ family response regulator
VRMADGPGDGRFTHGGVDYIYAAYSPEVVLPDGLTEAEQEIVRLIALGHSNAGIAEERGVSVRTVANQIRSIFRKTGVGARGDLIVSVRGAAS